MGARRAVTALATCVVLGICGACSGGAESPESRPAGPTPSSSPPSSPPPTGSAEPERSSQRVIVTHATVPQLDLDRATARAVRSGRVDDWQRLGRPAGPLRVVRALAAVEREPSAVGVVPLTDVGPSVVVARVGGVDPVRSEPGAVDLTVAGDLMLTRGVPDAAAALSPMTPLLRGADVTVGNLESTLSTDGAPTQGGDSFGGSPALLEPLRRAGFDAMSLANNHAGDYGVTALQQTVARMAESPIVPFGAGADLDAASRPAFVRSGGVRFAFVAFNAIGETPQAAPGVPGALSVRMPPRTGPLVPADLAHVASVVRRAGQRADVVVALPHWGTQYTHTPEPIQRTVARQLVDAGADLVVGGHPHWVQGADLVDGVPVVHSLGNFVFDMDFSAETMEGVVLESTWWGGDLKALRWVPYRMDDGSFAPRVVADDTAAGILADVWSTSTGPFAG